MSIFFFFSLTGERVDTVFCVQVFLSLTGKRVGTVYCVLQLCKEVHRVSLVFAARLQVEALVLVL